MPEDRIPKLIMELIPQERRKKKTSKKNVDGRSSSSHDNKKFRTISMEKQGGMGFGFRKTATAIIKPDIYIYIYTVVPPYLGAIRSKTYRRYVKPRIIPNAIYNVVFV
jgi:hypothetical protein